MSKKTVTMKMPIPKPTTAADAWVGESTTDVSEAPKSSKVVALRGEAETEPNKRLTIDITESLHKRIKAQCAMRGTKMADVIRELLEKEFAA
ncbi:plasmid partition protein ParG [Agrobacterium cavarae]|uniref:plasmid partition protein ParG n=1 Tax=Agrobacterium cavarae TaxID=2528239 RepID=UPI002FD9FFEC